MSNKGLLEVDESIIRNNLLLTEKKAEEQEFDALLRNFEKSEVPSTVFLPLPGTCVKCRTENGEKVFINICHTSEIPPPEDLTEQQFFAVLEEENPSWRIPLSISYERLEVAKDGKQCLTYDVALNTKYFEKIQSNKAMQSFTIMTIISGVSEKHSKNLENDFIILKNRKVIGKLHEHRAQRREPMKPVAKKPLIEDITGSCTKNVKIPEILQDSPYIILRKPKEGNAERLIGYFKLPNRHSIKDTKIDVGEDRVIVEALKTDYLVDVFVPYTLDQDNVTAFKDLTTNVVRLDMPVK